jgi:hypothetical protein
MWPTSSEDLVSHPKKQIQQNEQKQTFPHQTQPGRVSTQWTRIITTLKPVSTHEEDMVDDDGFHDDREMWEVTHVFEKTWKRLRVRVIQRVWITS